MANACGGQNKNQALLCMCSKWLLDAPKHIKSIEVIFPVRGHSFLPSDRVFGQVEREVRKYDVIANPDKYLEIIGSRTTTQRLSLDCPIFDWLSEAKRAFKATGSWHFKISLSKRFIFKRSTKNELNVLVKGEENYNTSLKAFKTITKKNDITNDINRTQIPKGMLNIKPVKIDNVKKLLEAHYGNDWTSKEELNYFRKVINEYHPATDPVDEEVLCEPQNELREYEMNLVSV